MSDENICSFEVERVIIAAFHDFHYDGFLYKLLVELTMTCVEKYFLYSV